ncbi:S-layer homology domain-containing protein [Ureibacillus aquaedulcis]|uniref:S-layer homology domain-containing protein n=1 Tax=Ureibacillus aquaedulcis TaxID=3058421 RepID=A0ABT8GUU0_9BACL|nr:S-layer homology domain-containing protein [Ureibacillus sp. BA0131]MDN4495157.1 S-layer homology domain-containing protein [Ureibacillus sp. BA0131]
MKKKTSKKMFNLAIASAMAAGAVVAVAPAATEAATPTLKDLKPGSWYYDSAVNLVERGVIKGYGDQTFRPGQELTREHAAVILARLLNLDTVSVTNPKFTDVPTTHRSYGAIAALENAGIINGIGNGKFGINSPLTRGQMAILITNVFDLKAGNINTPFVDIENYPYKYQVAALYDNGVTKGIKPTIFSPMSNVSRGEFVTFIVRAENVKPPTPENPGTPETPGTPTPPTTPTPGGGGGGSATPTPSLEEEVENVIGSLFETSGQAVTLPNYVTPGFNPASNTINLQVDGSVSLETLRQDLAAANDGAPSVGDIVNDEETLSNLAEVYSAVTSINAEGTEYTKDQFITDDLKLNKDTFKKIFGDFVNNNIGNATDLAGLIGKTTTITVNFDEYSSIPYTLTISEQ